MSEKTLTPEEEAEAARLAKLAEEEDEDFDLDLEEDEDEQDESLTDNALAAYNKRVGKNYKSWEDVAKREKEIDIAFSQKKVLPPKKETPKEENKLPSNLDERLLRAEEPLSKFVMEKMKAVSERTGQTLEEIWNEETGYFKGIATSISEKAKAKARLSIPSNAGGVEETKKQDEMSKKFMNPDKLPPGISFKK